MFPEREHKVNRNVYCQSDDRDSPACDSAAMAKEAKSAKNEPGDFGRNLKARREAMELTIDGVVNRSEVSRGYISSLETGAKRNPSEGIARRLAAALECHVSDLWGRGKSAFEERALELIRKMPKDRREAAIAALYGLAADETQERAA